MNRAIRIGLLLSIGTTSSFTLSAQTLQEWAQTVNWDGVSHWSKYIKSSAAYMGPNALPVPFIGNGSVDSNTWIAGTGHFHFSKGDKTQNIAFYGNYPIVKDVVTIDVAYIPVEHYRMSDAVKKERHVYYTHYDSKLAKGDVYLNGTVRFMKKWEKSIQLAVRFGFRLPSSNKLEAARFTDNMGYYADLSFGRPLSTHLKWIGMAGIYVWQLTGDGHRQNDAFLFGTGLEWNKNKWESTDQCSRLPGLFAQQWRQTCGGPCTCGKEIQSCRGTPAFTTGDQGFQVQQRGSRDPDIPEPESSGTG
jgi:hypothetical protein